MTKNKFSWTPGEARKPQRLHARGLGPKEISDEMHGRAVEPESGSPTIMALRRDGLAASPARAYLLRGTQRLGGFFNVLPREMGKVRT